METYVDSCPHNITEVLESSARLGCGQDKYGNDQYLCVPKADKTGLIELCYNGTMGLIKRGNCLETDGENLHWNNCLGFLSGCPENEYRSNEIYKYSACQIINAQHNCYLAESSCPNITSNTTASNTRLNLQPTISSPETSSHVAEIVGSVAAFLLVLAVILILAIFLWRRKRSQKTGTQESIRYEDVEVKELLLEKEDGSQVEVKELLLEKEDGTLVLDIIKTAKENDNNTQEHGKNNREMEAINEISNDPKHIEMSIHEDHNTRDLYQRIDVGDYNTWKTGLSDQFFTLTDDEVSMLFCFLSSDSGPPDFTDTEWLFLLNEIRQLVYGKKTPVTREEAQQTLDRLKSRDYLWEDQDKITEDTKDETMYRIASKESVITFCFSSYDTASVYLRSRGYNRKPGEKCVSSPACDNLLIRRLQMNILTHVTIEDTDIYDEIHQKLNIPVNNVMSSKDKREEFLNDLKKEGESVNSRNRTRNSVDHVTWLWRYGYGARPDIVRSCIGLHPHNDIYIIDKKAYRKPSKYHSCQPEVRCLLYCLLLTEKYQLNLDEQSHRIIRDKIRDKYFPFVTTESSVDIPQEITGTQNDVITFKSDDIRHDVMNAFVTECLVEDSDLEFFLTTASRDLISEYCRSWNYKKSDGERCLYVPDRPEKMYDLFIDKLQLVIISHCTVSDRSIRDSISKRLGVPSEVLRWEQEARERYVEYAKRGTQTVHHARGMIVGCAGAGKTTLLKRLLGCSEEEIKEVKSTEGLEVHEEIFDMCDKTRSVKARQITKDDKEEENSAKYVSAKTLTFFDFGGQCAYYACHQIYLTRRAFYVVVVDASKRFDQKVDKKVCDQDGSVFSEWTYGDYFVFWMKSIHTYCGSDNDKELKPVVLIVATHWEENNRQYKDKHAFLDSLHQQIPKNSNLSQYIVENNCYCIQFPVIALHSLSNHIFEIANHQRWKETIPKEWAFLEIEIKVRKHSERILKMEDLTTKIADDINQEDPERTTESDMLRYYHDAGKVLYFNENGLKQYIIIDVQWFIDAFKHIITDKLHFKGIPVTPKDWEDFYKTGNLENQLLTEIWRNDDNMMYEKLMNQNLDFRTRMLLMKRESDARYLLYHEKQLLSFMQRLGLIAVGNKSHYVPCMNRKEIEDAIPELIQRSESKTFVLIYRFSFLPFFIFFRLIVSCMQLKDWEVLITDGTSCLYRNAALFSVHNHNIVLSVTDTSIQLQIFHPVPGRSLEKDETCKIQNIIEDILKNISGTFHRSLLFERGFKCREDGKQMIALDIEGQFVQDKYFWENDGEIICPQHPIKDQHFINTTEISKFWNISKP